VANSYFWANTSKLTGLRTLFAKVAIGATGAPTLNTTLSVGVQTITRSGTGTYELTLSGQYEALLYCSVKILDDTTNSIYTTQVTAEDVASAKTLSFKCLGPTAADNTALTAVDPTNGSTLMIEIVLKYQ